MAVHRCPGAGARPADLLAALIGHGSERERHEEDEAMDQLLRAAGMAAPFLVLGALVAIVVWGRWRRVASPDMPHRSWFRDLGFDWRHGGGNPPLPPDPLRPFEDDPTG
jgi:hypothetical protein